MINGVPTRGSESRAAEAARNAHDDRSFTREDFHSIYLAELVEGKYWGIEHDLRVVRGKGLASIGVAPFTARFDYLYYTQTSLSLLGVQRALLPDEEESLLAGRAILPNAWFPSDHLPVAAALRFTER